MINNNSKLSEDETVEHLIKHLERDSYNIISYCTGHQRGTDIVDEKNNKILLIEVKGAKANHNSKIKKKTLF